MKIKAFISAFCVSKELEPFPVFVLDITDIDNYREILKDAFPVGVTELTELNFTVCLPVTELRSLEDKNHGEYRISYINQSTGLIEHKLIFIGIIVNHRKQLECYFNNIKIHKFID